MNAARNLRKRTTRRANHDRRRLFSERLEARLLLAGDLPNTFARFEDAIDSAGETDVVPIHLTSDNFTIDGLATLGFLLSPTDGSSLRPRPLDVASLAPGNVPTIHQQSVLDDGSSLTLAMLGHGDYDLNVSGIGETTGGWHLQVFLAGDVNGDFVVDRSDVLALIYELGSGVNDSLVAVAGDVNLDGAITGYDVARAASNMGVSTPLRVLTVSAELDPASETGLPADNLVNQTPVNIVGLTLAGADVSLDEDGDGFDDGTTVASAPTGAFNYTLLADLLPGENTLRVEARDSFGQVVQAETVVTLDDVAPTVTSTSPAEGDELNPLAGQNIPVSILFSEQMIAASVLSALSVSGDDTPSITPLSPSYDDATNTLSFEISESLTDSAINVSLAEDATDLAGNALGGGPFVLNFSINRVATITGVSPANGEEMVSLTREAIVRFSSKIDPATITPASLQVIALGQQVSGRRVVSSTEQFVTFFPDDPWNASTEIRVRIDGDLIIGRNGEALDADGDGVAGGLLTADFTTLPITRIPGTNVFGFVFDSFSELPIVGATIRVDAFPAANAVTDANGRFELVNMPAPEFFVHVDGSTATSAPAGFVYPNVGKPFHSVPGQTVQIEMDRTPFDIYLPPMALGDVQPLSPTETTEVGFGDAGKAELADMFPELDPSIFDLMQVTFAPGAAIDDFGNPATEASIIPVPPDRLPAPLPPNLNPQLVISIQAGGATNFDIPAEVVFPNLDGLARGEKSLIFSFDHDAGEWVVIGTGTVSEDGSAIVSDPGVGILAPGWHFVQVGTQTAGQPCKQGEVCVLAKGGRGDVIEVDLAGTGGSDFSQVSLAGGQVVYLDPSDIAAGHFFFVPDVAGSQGFVQSTFTGTLTRTNAQGQTETKTETGIVRVNIKVGYSSFALNGSVGSSGANNKLDVYRVQHRLRFFGFRGENNAMVPVTGQNGTVLRQAIKLFQAATRENGAGNPANEDGRVDPGFRTHNWLNASNAPNWMQVPQQFRSGVIGNEIWANSWTIDIVAAAGLGATVTSLTEYPDVGPTVHTEHKAGNDIDWNIDQNALDADTGSGPVDTTLPFDLTQLTATERSIVEDILAASNAAGSQFLEVLIGGTGTSPTGKDRSYPRIRGSLTAIGVSNRAVAGHHNHFHVSIRPPTRGGPAALADPDPSFFGTDDRIYYRFELSNGFELAGQTNQAGQFSEVLTPNVDYVAVFYQPSTNQSGIYSGQTNASGFVTDVGTIILDQFGGTDSDGDGLPDVGERAIGTSPTNSDTDGDGISDSAEIEQGLDPLDNRGFPTGIISSLQLPGSAQDVVVEGSTAYVATGSHGLAVVDVSQFNNPILLGQLDLPGNATDVDVDPALGRAAVTTNLGGLAIIDVSDPMMPEVAHVTTNVLGSRVEVFDGVAFVSVGGSLTSVDLLTGGILETIGLGGTITDIAREGSFLYTMNTSRQLRVVDITGGNMVARGSVFLPDGGGKLFVGNGIAYAAAANTSVGGFATANVSNPDSPTVISGTDAPTTSAPGTAIVSNGSGIGLLVGRSLRVTGDPPSLQLVDVSDPANTYDLLLQIGLPATPNQIAVASGIAFVADGSAGLQVINYLPFDSQGQAPTVSISTTAVDVDPDMPGVQVVEGTSIPIQADVTDDVQVRNVELIVNGEVVRNDVSFPFDFSAIALSDDPEAPVTNVQVRATDTGGNVALSNLLSIDLVPDTFPPLVENLDPSNGAVVLQGHQTFRIRFSEPLDTATVTTDNIRIVEDGEDGVFGTADDTTATISNLQLRADDTFVQLLSEPLDAGNYQIQIAEDRVTDRAGNAMGTGVFISSFTVDNVAPKLTNLVVTSPINENDVATLSGEIVDPGVTDTFSLTVDWDEGDPETFELAAGTTSFSATHQYLDDNPTGTPSDEYILTVTVTDNHGGSTSTSGRGGSSGPIDLGIFAADSPSSVAVSQFLATGLFESVTVHDVRSSTPTLGTLQAFDAVLAYTNFVPANTGALGNVLADYVDAGGHLVVSTYSFSNPWDIEGRITTSGYSPLSNLGFNGNVSGVLVTTVPSDPIFDGIDVSAISYFHNSNFAHPGVDTGATLLATDGSGHNMLARNADGNVIGVNLFPGRQVGGNNQELYNLIGNALTTGGGTTVIVNNVAPVVNPIVGPTPSPAVQGQTLSFSGSFSDVGTLDTHEVQWDFGDGTVLPFAPSDNPGALSPNHSYADGGIFVVTL